MKKNLKSIFLIISAIIILTRCNQSIKIENSVDYGINHQILNIARDIEISKSGVSNITIWFYVNNDSIFVKFIDGTFTSLNGILSEQTYFSGYKQVDSVYLVFIQEELSTDPLNNFVVKDSLSFDSKPFDIVDTTKSYRLFEPTQRIYYINKDDSLIFIKEELI